jgi:hypothetical protein
MRPVGFPSHELDDLEGDWHLEGEVLGKPIVQDVRVEWVLGGTFLRMHYLPSTVTPLTEAPYEAVAYIGWDPAGCFVMSLFDTFGAAYSVPGYGRTLAGAGIRFEFEYQQGGFVTDLIPRENGWRIEQYSTEGDRLVPFGSKMLTPH